MALINDTFKFGVTFSDTYTRVSACNYANAFKKVVTQNELDMTDLENPVPVPPTVTWEKTKRVEFSTTTYLSQDSFEEQAESIDTKTHGFYVPVEETSVDLLELSYSYLKTLPEFENATDA
tara:strand:+ start:1025 stop:1387 length:363 start_codon:yes stop_codon:yes gene_type:complete